MLDEHDLVERIETRFDNAVLGDTRFEAVFADYKDFGGVKFPTHIVQREGGYPVLDFAITEVKPNVAAAIEVPASVSQAPAPVPRPMTADLLSDGVWNLHLDGRDCSVLVETISRWWRPMTARRSPSRPST